jgi:hypothetical protein
MVEDGEDRAQGCGKEARRSGGGVIGAAAAARKVRGEKQREKGAVETTGCGFRGVEGGSRGEAVTRVGGRPARADGKEDGTFSPLHSF